MLIINQEKNTFPFGFNKGPPHPPSIFSDDSVLYNQATMLSKASKISPEYPSLSGLILHDSCASSEKTDLFYFTFLTESCPPLFKSTDPCIHPLKQHLLSTYCGYVLVVYPRAIPPFSLLRVPFCSCISWLYTQGRGALSLPWSQVMDLNWPEPGMLISFPLAVTGFALSCSVLGNEL